MISLMLLMLLSNLGALLMLLWLCVLLRLMLLYVLRLLWSMLLSLDHAAAPMLLNLDLSMLQSSSTACLSCPVCVCGRARCSAYWAHE